MVKNKIRMVFYCSKTTKELIDNQSKLLGISGSNFIRSAVFDKLKKPIYQPLKHDFITQENMLQLLRIGNNLNQIARKLNTGVPFLIADQQAVINEIESLKEQVITIKTKIANNGK